MRLADSFPQNANAKLHIIFQISITFTTKIDINGDFFIFRHKLINIIEEKYHRKRFPNLIIT